jgi:twitching motility two-component system response regulator PilH
MAKLKILVVDDSPTEMRLVTAALAKQGYQIVTAVDGEDGLAKALTEQPNLVVLDVVMPKKNGYQVCRALKTSPATAHLPVILLTSKSQDTDRFWGLKQGADAYLTKPFEEAELLANVAALL